MRRAHCCIRARKAPHKYATLQYRDLEIVSCCTAQQHPAKSQCCREEKLSQLSFPALSISASGGFNKRAASSPGGKKETALPQQGMGQGLPQSLPWWNSNCGDLLRRQRAGSFSHPAGLLLSLGVVLMAVQSLGPSTATRCGACCSCCSAIRSGGGREGEGLLLPLRGVLAHLGMRKC